MQVCFPDMKCGQICSVTLLSCSRPKHKHQSPHQAPHDTGSIKQLMLGKGFKVDIKQQAKPQGCGLTTSSAQNPSSPANVDACSSWSSLPWHRPCLPAYTAHAHIKHTHARTRYNQRQSKTAKQKHTHILFISTRSSAKRARMSAWVRTLVIDEAEREANVNLLGFFTDLPSLPYV